MSIIYEALKKVESKDKDKSPKEGKKTALTLILSLVGIIFIIILGSQYSRNKTPLAQAKGEKVKQFSRKEVKKKGTMAQTTIGISTARSQSVAEKIASPPPPEEGGSADYMLEGIIYDSESPLAIINGKIFKKQDKIDDWQVIDITPTAVELRNLKDNTTFSLKL
jgi:hypothetical protein